MGNVKVSQFKFGNMAGRVVEVGNQQQVPWGPKGEYMYDVFLDGVKVGEVEKCHGGWAGFVGDRNWRGNQAAYRVPNRSRKEAAEDIARDWAKYFEGK